MKWLRRILFWLHLAAGVTAGLVILVMSVTGVILSFENADTQSTGQKLRAWLRWVHTGEAGGLAGQSIAALASAGAAVLAITGLLLAGRRLAGRYRSSPPSSL
jgi:uncharacterized iron-regulated membrane protein